MHLKTLLAGLMVVISAAGAQAPAAPTKAAKTPASYKKEIPPKLATRAKVAESAAATAALAKVPGGAIQGVELEEEGGKLIYSYDIKVAGKKGIEEVHVDAVSGGVSAPEHEGAASEKKEAAADSAKSGKSAKPGVKKPPVKKP